MASSDPCLLVFSPFLAPSHNWADLCNLKDIMKMIVYIFSGWIIKDIATSVLYSIGSVGLGEASHCVIRTLKHPYGGVHVGKN